jgi:hypothetical protein
MLLLGFGFEKTRVFRKFAPTEGGESNKNGKRGEGKTFYFARGEGQEQGPSDPWGSEGL